MQRELDELAEALEEAKYATQIQVIYSTQYTCSIPLYLH